MTEIPTLGLILKTLTLILVIVIIGATTPTIVYAAPVWKTYNSVDCGMEIEYPVYKATGLPVDINTDKNNAFKIETFSSSFDEDSLTVFITVDCSQINTPLTTEMMEPLQTKAMEKPDDSIVYAFSAMEYQEPSLDFLTVDGEQTGNFIVDGEQGLFTTLDSEWMKHILVTNHGDKQYIIELYYSGNKVIPDFKETFSTLDNI